MKFIDWLDTVRRNLRFRRAARKTRFSHQYAELLEVRELLAAATLSALTDTTAAANQLAENISNGATVGITARATNSVGARVTYSLLDSANGVF